MSFICPNTFNPHNNPVSRYCYHDTHFIREGMGHREVKELAQGHTANKWQSQDLKQGSLVPESMLLTATLPLPHVNFAVL